MSPWGEFIIENCEEYKGKLYFSLDYASYSITVYQKNWEYFVWRHGLSSAGIYKILELCKKLGIILI